METGIYNAYIKSAKIRKNCDLCREPIEIFLEINTTVGGVCTSYDLKYLSKLMSILHINDFKDITNKPCVVFIYDGFLKDIGDFMFYHYDWLEYTDEEEDWLENNELRTKLDIYKKDKT